jgi:predicted RNA polymerase sigma factor
VAPNPIVTLNRAVAVAMADNARAGLAVLATVEDDPRLTAQHRLDAVRAHLLELDGDSAGALAAYRAAARRTTSIPERRYLDAQAARLAAGLPLRTLPPDATP